jgi:hypothetical protein
MPSNRLKSRHGFIANIRVWVRADEETFIAWPHVGLANGCQWLKPKDVT